MATATPKVAGDVLILDDGGEPTAIVVGSPAWFAWLDEASGFTYQGERGSFTARREPRQRGGWYWKAYRRRDGKLRRAYLGKAPDLSAERLASAAAALAGVPPAAAAPPPAPSLASPGLISTKLMPPPARAGMLPRSRLLDRMRLALDRPLTLVVAPAGFGKTTLVASWLRTLGRDVRTAWLTLDEADNEPVRFWTYLVAALQQVRPGVGSEATALLRVARPGMVDPAVTALINALAACPDELALVLDDFHGIVSESIQQQLASFITYLPARFHLVITSRTDLGLPLARLRARSLLGEIRADDLRCTGDEAAALLRLLLGRELPPESIHHLVERTEGWVAGLQLAAISIQGQLDPDQRPVQIGGEDRYIWDYLIDEVLAQQPAHIQQFLLRTALLDRFCAPLCDVLLPEGAPASQSTLDQVERFNLFIVPLDRERRWYRYHHLFAQVLRLRLAQTSPELPRSIHRSAAAWLWGQRLYEEALQHCQRAEDWGQMVRWVEHLVEDLMMRGELAIIIRWAELLPPQQLKRRYRLNIYYAAALAILGRLEDASAAMEHARQATAYADSDPSLAMRPGELEALQSIVASTQGNMESAIDYAGRALDLLPPQRSILRLGATMIMGSMLWMRGKMQQTVAFLEDRMVDAASYGGEIVYAWVDMLMIYVFRSQGKIASAIQKARQILAPLDDPSLPVPISAGLAAAQLAEIYYEQCNFYEALLLAQRGFALGQQIGSTEQQAFNSVVIARVYQAFGDAAEARACMAQAVQYVATQPIEYRVAQSFQARLWLQQGNLEASLAWLSEALQHPLLVQYVWGSEPLTIARVYLATDAARAIPLLVEQQALAIQDGRFGELIDVRALLALAYAAVGEQEQALDVLALALAQAERDSIMRTFLDLGDPMLDLLRRARSCGIAPAFVARLLDVAALPPRPAAAAAAPPALLSEREREVLQLVAIGQPNRAIAGSLVIAPSTVKMHLKNIYSKLGVHSRTQAVAAARRLGLL
ncbi:hypothetical protein F8S13_21315 [Chloroflexia bacterium SDU3-3]|nr:hypothetical protein F8S13_21315 [Chloroflexia bacterium SDU3-3]